MIVAFDAKRAFLNFTGLGNFSRSLLYSLEKVEPKNKYLLYTPGFDYNDRTKDLFESNSLEVKMATSPWCYFPRALWRQFGLASELKKDHATVFHGLSAELPYGIDQSKLRIIVTVHDLIFLRFPKYYSLINRLIYKYKTKRACKLADVVVAISEQTKADLIEYLQIPSEKIKVIYQSCDPQFLVKQNRQSLQNTLIKYNVSSPFYLMVGSIEERKNQLNLVKAFHKIADQVDQNLVLIGKSSKYQQKMEDYIKENKLQNRVVILNSVDFKDLPAFYQACDVFCYISLFEGFGIPLLEAALSEVPILTSIGSCFSEAAGESATYVNPKDVDAIAKNLKDLLHDSSKKSKIQAQYNHALTFTEENMAKSYLKLYSA